MTSFGIVQYFVIESTELTESTIPTTRKLFSSRSLGPDSVVSVDSITDVDSPAITNQPSSGTVSCDGGTADSLIWRESQVDASSGAGPQAAPTTAARPFAPRPATSTTRPTTSFVRLDVAPNARRSFHSRRGTVLPRCGRPAMARQGILAQFDRLVVPRPGHHVACQPARATDYRGGHA